MLYMVFLRLIGARWVAEGGPRAGARRCVALGAIRPNSPGSKLVTSYNEARLDTY